MNYSDDLISQLGKQTGFVNSNIEKVVRLLDVLSFISTELDHNQDKLVLKGGTAINLIYTNLARLSVDIDLDYIGSLEKDKAKKDRDIIIDELDEYMRQEGYFVSSKSRGSYVLASRIYSYVNAFGNRDNIKVEINFIDRIHIGPTSRKTVKYFDKKVIIQTLTEEELFGMKICALIDRHKPRDLFDVNELKMHCSHLNLDKLRKMTIFYMSLDGIFNLDDNVLNKIKNISLDTIKKELLPVVKKGSKFNVNTVKEEVLAFLGDLLVLNDNENKYLEEFAKGNYYPKLLFDEIYAENAAKHPMAMWMVANIKN